MSPKKINTTNSPIVFFLGLTPSQAILLKYRKPSSFTPEPDNCHINVWVQCDKHGGKPQQGWIIGQDLQNDFLEARFHSVWLSPSGKLIDLTPRSDKEKRIMFLPDPEREIMLSKHDNMPAVISYDTVKVVRGQIQTGLKQIKIVPQSDMIYKYGLAERY